MVNLFSIIIKILNNRVFRYLLYGLIILFLFWKINSLKKEKEELQITNERLSSNLDFYSATVESNKVLRLTIDELQHSRDSILILIDSIRNVEKIKIKNIETISYIESVIKDTLVAIIPEECVFQESFNPNDQTHIEIIKTDTSLIVIPSIANQQTLFITKESKYYYRTFFGRLFHWNFKKKIDYKYSIQNSNDLIFTNDVRIVNIEKDGRRE